MNKITPAASICLAHNPHYDMGYFRLTALQKKALTCIQAFCDSIEKTVTQCSDPNVARQTLNWWQAEMTQAYAEKPICNHPLIQEMQPFFAPFGWALSDFLSIIAGYEQDLLQARYTTDSELMQYCYKIGAQSKLSAQVLGISEANDLQAAQQLGAFIRYARLLTQVGLHIRQGRIYLPISELEKHQVTASALYDCQDTPEFNALMTAQLTQAHGLHEQAFRQFSPVALKSGRVLLAQADVLAATLYELHKEGLGRVLKQHLRLGLLRRYLITWRRVVLG